MNQSRHTPQAQALLNTSSRHLFGEPCQLSVQQYQQLWLSAQSQGDRKAQQVLRQQVVAAGLLHVDIEGGRRRQGLAHHLVAEALHDLGQEGVSLVEAHSSGANAAATKLFQKLGFVAVEAGPVYRLS